MGLELEYFVSDESGNRGPLPLVALRETLSSEAKGTRVRVEGCEPWLPLEAWDVLADLCPAPALPEAPSVEPATKLPAELAGIAPSVRERLLWFVADADGVMGPVNGEFIRKGLASAKIKMGAGVCMVAAASWVRASLAFPSALEGATAIRPRPLATVPCAACLEPCAPSDSECMACGEPVRRVDRSLSRSTIAMLVVAAFLALLAIALGTGLLVRMRVGVAPSLGFEAPA